tara:strand:+ start:1182 stop:2279 length:1098 start_codon:yes stop_codon:yes gene_type:complete
MKILIIAEFFKKGGTVNFLKKLLKINKELEIETNLLMEQHLKNNEIEEICERYKFSVNYYKTRKKIFYIPYLSIIYDSFIYYMYIYRNKYDILFISNSSPWMYITYLFLGNKVIYFCHSYPDRYLSFFYKYMCLIPRAIKKKNRVISVSKYGKKQLVKFIGFKKEKVEVIYNSYLNKIDNNLPNYHNERIILTIGRLTYIKNPDIWLKVVNKVSTIEPNIKFVWVGADINQMEIMCKKIDELELNEFAEIVEYINDPVSYYSKSYIYFQPSLIESHGIAVIDAMASGLPCVVSNVGGLRESIINNKTGFLVAPTNVNGFVEKIVLLLDNVELSKRLGLSGKRFAHEKFSEDLQKYKFLTLYNKLV